jgi:hypothetical protein
MATFLNLSLDKNVSTNFLAKHLLFSTFWILGISLFVFRIDLFLVVNYPSSLHWLKVSLPTLYITLVIVTFFFLKWYYILAFFVYPFLLLFWFVPKTILINGKIYLFGNYITFLFSKLAHFKRTVFYGLFIIFTLILFVTISSDWARWLAIATFSYFYLRYVYGLLRKSFQEPSLFGESLEDKIRVIITKNSTEESLIIKSFINQKDDEKLKLPDRREKQIRRSVIANHAIELLTYKLNGFKGRKAFLIAWVYSSFKFLFYSILFFWFLNLQLFRIDNANFSYNGKMPAFDFLYYTLKTITFGDIETVKPVTVSARCSEISSFFIIGIFFLVIFVSVLLSLKQDKMNENVKLTTELFRNENSTLERYFKEEFGMEIKSAMGELSNIDKSLKNLRDIIDKLF